jgi:hypothetical protein
MRKTFAFRGAIMTESSWKKKHKMAPNGFSPTPCPGVMLRLRFSA